MCLLLRAGRMRGAGGVKSGGVSGVGSVAVHRGTQHGGGRGTARRGALVDKDKRLEDVLDDAALVAVLALDDVHRRVDFELLR